MERPLWAYAATSLAALMRAREVSAEAVLDAHAERIAERNGAINALVSLDLDSARRAAQALDARAASGDFAGPLHGLPVAIKDIFETERMRTTWGSRAHQTHVPAGDALHVARIRAAGAVILGKTNTSEFAYGGQTTSAVHGLTRNPHDLTRTVAGSSGGAAAALAAQMVALADGSDRGGSLRSPAAWCGVVGFRPTSGIVPNLPCASPFDGLHTPGPMARTVADTALFLSAMAGPDPRDPLSHGLHGIDFAAPLHSDLAGLRLAWCMTPGGCETCPQIVEALAPARAMLTTLGVTVTDACPDIADLMEAHHIVRSYHAFVEVGAEVGARLEAFGPVLRAVVCAGRNLTAPDLARAERIRTRCWRTITRFFADFDAMVWPATCGMAFPADLDDAEVTEDWRPVELTPLLELPALSVPFGRTPDGLPSGLQLLGPRFSDFTLLQIAHGVETAQKRGKA